MHNIKSVSVKVQGAIDLLEAAQIADAIQNLVGEDTAMEFEGSASADEENNDISVNVVIKRNV